MKNVLLIIPIFLFVNSAIAAQSQIECVGIETPEWNITGEFGGAQVELFDNDSYSKFNHVMALESHPVQMVYAEEGNENNTITIVGVVSAQETSTKASYSGGNGTTEEFDCKIIQ